MAGMAKERIVLIATHVVPDVESVADGILLLRRGELADLGSPRELIEKYAPGGRWRTSISPCSAMRIRHEAFCGRAAQALEKPVLPGLPGRAGAGQPVFALDRGAAFGRPRAASAYRQMAQDLHGLPAPRQLALVEDRLRQTTALYRIDQIVRTEAMDPKAARCCASRTPTCSANTASYTLRAGFCPMPPRWPRSISF